MKKVYFACSIRGGREDVNIYSSIVKLLQKINLKVLTEHVGNSNISHEGEKTLTPNYIYQRDMAWIKESELLIAEVTTPSLGVGYEIAKAEELNMPVLCLFRPSSGRSLSAMIDGSPKVRVFEYEKVEELEKPIKELVGSI